MSGSGSIMALFGRAAAAAAAAPAAAPAAEPSAKRRNTGLGKPQSASGQTSRRSSDGSLPVSTAEHDMQINRDIEMLDTHIDDFKLKPTEEQKEVRKPNPASPRSFFL